MNLKTVVDLSKNDANNAEDVQSKLNKTNQGSL